MPGRFRLPRDAKHNRGAPLPVCVGSVSKLLLGQADRISSHDDRSPRKTSERDSGTSGIHRGCRSVTQVLSRKNPVGGDMILRIL